MPPTFLIVGALRRWGAGLCGFWRLRLRSLSGRCPLDILDALERQTILRGWNDTGRAVLPASVPELFAAQALRRPEAVAVVLEDEELSYGALDARANQLAHHLRGLGWDLRLWWGCALSARWRWWWACSASSRPAAPIFRSIRIIQPSG